MVSKRKPAKKTAKKSTNRPGAKAKVRRRTPLKKDTIPDEVTGKFLVCSVKLTLEASYLRLNDEHGNEFVDNVLSATRFASRGEAQDALDDELMVAAPDAPALKAKVMHAETFLRMTYGFLTVADERGKKKVVLQSDVIRKADKATTFERARELKLRELEHAVSEADKLAAEFENKWY